jgi:hypothetical protein
MKTKLAILAAVLVYLCGLCGQVNADTVSISFTEGSAYNLQAQLTTQLISATFFYPDGDFLITGTDSEVVAMTGTLNGNPVSLSSGWGSIIGGVFFPGDVQFTANGSPFSFFIFEGNEVIDTAFETDNPVILPSLPSIGTGVPVATPEPPLLVLLAIGLVGLGWRRLKA